MPTATRRCCTGATGRAHAFAPDEELAKTLVHTLEPVVGADHVRASVHVEYDLGTSEETQETYDPKTPIPLTQEHSEESSTGRARPAGVPGTASNVPDSTAAPPPLRPRGDGRPRRSTAAAASASSSPVEIRFDDLCHQQEPASQRGAGGTGAADAAAVLVDDASSGHGAGGKAVSTRRKRTPEEMKQIEQLARAAIGVDAQRGDVLAVENFRSRSFRSKPLSPPTQSRYAGASCSCPGRGRCAMSGGRCCFWWCTS
jgi:flagellar M-ring protein FliF